MYKNYKKCNICYVTAFITFMKITHNVYYGHIFLSSIPLIKNRIFTSFLHLPKKI